MLVKFNDASKQHKISIKEFHRFAFEGEFLEVDEDRAKALLGDNPMHIIFVEKATPDEVAYKAMLADPEFDGTFSE